MKGAPLYLDHASTSWPKSPRVAAAVAQALLDPGVAPDRGGGARGRLAAAIVEEARRLVARLLAVPEPARVSLTLNATDALNLALKAIVRPGDEVVTTAVEHNSVARPLARLERDAGVALRSAPAGARGVVAAQELLARITPRTRLVVLGHASNVTGALQPVGAVGRALRALPEAARPLLLVDAAQSAGYRPLDEVGEVADLVAGAGHKGPGGPLGTGFLWVRPGLELVPWREGGTGHRSEEPLQPLDVAGALEAGSPNVPGIAGLAAALAERLDEEGLATVAARRAEVAAEFLAQLSASPGVEWFGPPAGAREPVFPLRLRGWSVAEASHLLEAEYGIAQRAGLHCNPGVHRALGTFPEGTLRLSFGARATASEVTQAVAALRDLVRAAP